jgi:hypothetical protein
LARKRLIGDGEAVIENSAHPIPSCSECGLESAGRCTACRRYLCVDHFSFEEHQPCAARLVSHAHEHICYVCGVAVQPQQWSTSVFAHYVDSGRCKGCNRYVCELNHTAVRDDAVEILRDGLRSHRYHVTYRYCGVCAPVRHFGGMVRTVRALAILAVVVGIAFFAFQALA